MKSLSIHGTESVDSIIFSSASQQDSIDSKILGIASHSNNNEWNNLCSAYPFKSWIILFSDSGTGTGIYGSRMKYFVPMTKFTISKQMLKSTWI